MNTNPRQVGEVVPQLFIGLGGGGNDMVTRIYKRFHSNPDWVKYRKETTSFLLVDTNYKDLQRAANLDGVMVEMISDPSLEALNLILQRGDHFIKSWRGNAAPRSSAVGAGQIRIEARTKLYAVEERVRRSVGEALDRTIREGNQFLKMSGGKLYEVMIFGTLGGGTCSGSFLPMTYLVRDEIRKRKWNPQVTAHFVYGVGVAGRVGELSDFVMANSHAAIMEIEHLQRSFVEGVPVSFAYRQPQGENEPLLQLAEPPFDWIYLADKPDFDLDAGDRIDEALADAAYINLISPSRTWFDGAADNYTRFRVKTHKKLAPDAAGGVHLKDVRYSAYWATIGASALVLPAADFAAYCAERTVARLLREQFRGGAETGGEDLPADVYRPDQIRLIRAAQWVERLEANALKQYTKAQEIKAKFKGKFTDAISGSDEGGAGPLSDMLYRVTGKVPGATTPKAVKDPSADDTGPQVDDEKKQDAPAAEGPTVANTSEPLIAKVVKLVAEQVKLRRVELEARSFSPEELVQNADSNFSQMQAEAEKVAARVRVARDDIHRFFSTTMWLEELRKKQPATEAIDATTLRLLIAKLRLGSSDTKVPSLLAESGASDWAGIDNAINTAAEKLKQTNGTFLNIQKEDRDQLTKEFATGQFVNQRRVDDSPIARIRNLVTGAKVEVEFKGKQSKFQQIFNEKTQITNIYNDLVLCVGALEGLKAFLDQRLNTYVLAGEEAERSAVELERTASLRVSGEARNVAPYTVGFEVLQIIGQKPDHRLWRHFYEDRFEEPIMAEADAATIGAVVDEVISTHEQGKAFLPHKALVEITKRLDALVMPSVHRLVFGESAEDTRTLTLTDALEYEAYCSMIKDPMTLERSGRESVTSKSRFEEALETRTKPKSRREEIERLKQIFHDTSHPEHVAVESHIRSYVKKKLEAVIGRASTLATVSEGDQGSPSHRACIAVVDSSIDKKLKPLMPKDGDWKSLMALNIDGTGVQSWDDRHSIFVFTGHGSLPVWRFRYLDASFEAYQRIMESTHWEKPHPLHIDVSWEGQLMIVSAKYHENLYKRTKRKEARRLFIEAAVRGLITMGGSKPEDHGWYLRLGTGKEANEAQREAASRPLGEDAGLIVARFTEIMMQQPQTTDAIEHATTPKESAANAKALLAALADALGKASALTDRPLPEGLKAVLDGEEFDEKIDKKTGLEFPGLRTRLGQNAA